MIIDCHTHIGSLPDTGERTVDGLIVSMDEAGIDLSIILANDLEGIPGSGTDETIERASAFPERLRVMANFDFLKMKRVGYMAELKRQLKEDLVVGLKFYPGYQSYDLYGAELHELYDFCQSERIPVMFHTGFLLEGSKGMASNPMMISPLAEKFTELTIVAAHFGNPFIEECGDLMRCHGNVYADLSGYFTEFRPISRKEVGEMRRDIDKLRRLIGGLERLLFGTDWPLYSQKEYMESVKSLSLSEKERELIFSGNAQRIFLQSEAPYQNNS